MLQKRICIVLSQNKSFVSIFTSHNWEQGWKMGWMGVKTQNSKSIFLCMVSKQCVVVKVGQSSVKKRYFCVSSCFDWKMKQVWCIFNPSKTVEKCQGLQEPQRKTQSSESEPICLFPLWVAQFKGKITYPSIIKIMLMLLHPQKQDALAKLQKFSVLLWRPKLPWNKRVWGPFQCL